ncbi:MAG: hypothetical protein ACOCSN_03925 [Halanaeroarchaeum sp.]
MELPIRDRLDGVGSAAGTFVVLLGLATLLGQPWQYTGGAAVTTLQILGALATVAIGVGLVYLSHVVE